MSPSTRPTPDGHPSPRPGSQLAGQPSPRPNDPPTARPTVQPVAAAPSATSTRRWLSRAGGVYLVIASLLVGLLAWLALYLLADIAADPPYPKDEIPSLALRFIESPAWMPVLSLPALLIGVILLVRAPRRVLAAVLVGSAALLIPFLVAVYCFVALIAPMYEYREI